MTAFGKRVLPGAHRGIKAVSDPGELSVPSENEGPDSEVSDQGDRQVVLVHDYLLVMRGAERSFMAMCDLWPTAPVATLLFDPDVFGKRLAGHPIRTSALQRLGLDQSNFKRAMPVMPPAVERLNVSDAEVVVSSSSAFAHGVRTTPDTVHVCYCYTPFRYAWYERERGIKSAPFWARPLVASSLKQIRRWDLRAVQRNTRYVAISKLSQDRIYQFWGLEAPILHPPVELDRFSTGDPEDFYLFVGELVQHKQVETALQAAVRANAPIKVVGGGADDLRLRSLYGKHADFLGRVDDKALADLYRRARALVIPNVEEFGITAVESQASGRPVLAAGAGGALETVVENETGWFFDPGNIDQLTELLRSCQPESLDPANAVANAQRFSVQAFQRGLLNEVKTASRAAE